MIWRSNGSRLTSQSSCARAGPAAAPRTAAATSAAARRRAGAPIVQSLTHEGPPGPEGRELRQRAAAGQRDGARLADALEERVEAIATLLLAELAHQARVAARHVGEADAGASQGLAPGLPADLAARPDDLAGLRELELQTD